MKKVSCEYIIAKALKDFKIEDTSWLNDAVDWVGDAIEAIGYHCGFIGITATYDVKNHLCPIPCNLISLKGVEYNGARLPLGSDTSGMNLYKNEDGSVSTITDEQFLELRALWAKIEIQDQLILDAETVTEDMLLDKEDLLKQVTLITYNKRLNSSVIEQSVLPYYNVNANFIQTSFDSGCITIIGKAFQLDDKGFPMVVDTYKYREAVKWFIIRGTLLQGYRHPVITLEFAEGMWRDFRYKASCEQKMPSADALERFHNRWHSIKRGMDLGQSWFINAEAQQGSIY